MNSQQPIPTQVQDGPHQGDLVDSIEGHQVIDCRSCGLRHILPLPDPAELERLYRDRYFSQENPKHLEQRQEDQAWWDLVYQDRCDSFQQLLGPGPHRVLDVGSGAGYFPRHIQTERGWTVLAVEPSRQAAEFARSLGVPVINDFFSSRLAAELGQFQVVQADHVLEHVPDPARLVVDIRGLLVPGGVACIIVPNDYNPFQQALRDACGVHPWWLVPRHHLNYFNADSLTGLLERHDFVIERVEASFPIDLFLLMGDDYLTDPALGRACHRKRMNFETHLRQAGLNDLRRELYRRLAELGLGRDLVVYARAPE